MPRGIWKGDINFGLVSIPVTLISADAHKEIKLHLLDKRDLAPIAYERVNKFTRKKVPWEQIVEGFEYEPGSYAILLRGEIAKIHKKATHNIDIIEFVDEKTIDSMLFDRPYYLEPSKKAKHAYALLRGALQRSGKVGIAKVIIHTRQHLAALTIRENALVLETMRFPEDLRSSDEFEVPDENLKHSKITMKEIKMAEQLIASMTGKWNPKKYKDDYRTDFLHYIKQKIKLGETAAIKEEEAEEGETAVTPRGAPDLMALLKKSIPQKKAISRAKSNKASSKKKISRRKLKK